jgi:hypothetical protein
VPESRGGQAEAVSTSLDSYREATKKLTRIRKPADELILDEDTAHDRATAFSRTSSAAS